MKLVSIVVLLFLFLFPLQFAHAEEPRFEAELSGAEEVPPVETEGSGGRSSNSTGRASDSSLSGRT
jgi:hypothetical protein